MTDNKFAPSQPVGKLYTPRLLRKGKLLIPLFRHSKSAWHATCFTTYTVFDARIRGTEPMSLLQKTLLGGVSLLSIALAYSTPASASTIFAEAILNNGAPVTLINSSAVNGNFSLNSPVTLGGIYVVGTAGASAYPLLQPYPNFSTQLQVSTPNSNAVMGDTIEIRFTESSQSPSPISPFDVLVGLTANVLTNFSVQSGYWYDDGNANFALTTLIASGNPSFGSPLAFTTTISPTAPYTITADYILTVTSSGFVQSNVTTDLILQVPEPVSIALIGTGLAALGMVRSRRRRG